MSTKAATVSEDGCDKFYMDFMAAIDTVDLLFQQPQFANVKVINTYDAGVMLGEWQRTGKITYSVYESATAMTDHFCFKVEVKRGSSELKPIPHYSDLVNNNTRLAWKDFQNRLVKFRLPTGERRVLLLDAIYEEYPSKMPAAEWSTLCFKKRWELRQRIISVAKEFGCKLTVVNFMNVDISFVPVYIDSKNDTEELETKTLRALNVDPLHLGSKLEVYEDLDRWLLGFRVGDEVVPFVCVDFLFDPNAEPPGTEKDDRQTMPAQVTEGLHLAFTPSRPAPGNSSESPYLY
jgi:hypothetical protein